jgi:hypothetical protein
MSEWLFLIEHGTKANTADKKIVLKQTIKMLGKTVKRQH